MISGFYPYIFILECIIDVCILFEYLTESKTKFHCTVQKYFTMAKKLILV